MSVEIWKQRRIQNLSHCLKSVRIRSFYGLYFPAFGLNLGKYGPEKLRIRTLFTQCQAVNIYMAINYFRKNIQVRCLTELWILLFKKIFLLTLHAAQKLRISLKIFITNLFSICKQIHRKNFSAVSVHSKTCLMLKIARQICKAYLMLKIGCQTWSAN